MKIRGIILATTFLLMLIVATVSQHYVFAESSLLTTISVNTETGASTNITGATENMTQETPTEYHARGNASIPPPQVIFPSQEEIENYFLDKNVTAPTFIGNSSLGNTTNIQKASSNGITYVVFQTKLNGTDHVFLTMIRDPEITRGAAFSEPVELTPAHHGNISHLQIAADIDNAFAVWQDYNSTTGLSSIFVSSSMDSGEIFRTYRASENNTDAFDPSVAPNGVVVWKEPCPPPDGGPTPPDGPIPDPDLDSGLPPPLDCPIYYVGW
jgi:hypothetical protein